ncbi:hypothetical protein HZS_1013 [Henneguya salminicola]|nr:hypothetical protein HZS_1013 [Henneguya salminicola]
MELECLKIIPGGKLIPECDYDSKRFSVDNILTSYASNIASSKYLLSNICYSSIGKVRIQSRKIIQCGFREANLIDNFDCYIFHDVDFILLNDHLKYVCDNSPSHFGTSASQFDYYLPFNEYFGGVVALSKKHYIETNGFSNCFWGYEKEDGDMYLRVEARGYHVYRQPKNIGKYFSDHKNHIRNIVDPLWKINEYIFMFI